MSIDVKTALCVLLPEDLNSWVQECRQSHDKAFARWPPHINLLFPFIPQAQFAAKLPLIQNALATLPSFRLKLHKTSFFEHGPHSLTLVLKPEESVPGSLDKLQRTLQDLFPHCSQQRDVGKGEFVPHLTLGQFKTRDALEAKMAQLQSKFVIDFELKSVALMARTANDPFEAVHIVPLGNNLQSTSNTEEDDWLGNISFFEEMPIASSSTDTDKPVITATPPKTKKTTLLAQKTSTTKVSERSSITTRSTTKSKFESLTSTPLGTSYLKKAEPPVKPASETKSFKSSYYQNKSSPTSKISTLKTEKAEKTPKKEKNPTATSKLSSIGSPSSNLSQPPKYFKPIEPPTVPVFTAIAPSVLPTSQISAFPAIKPPSATISFTSPSKKPEDIKPKSSYYATKKATIGIRTSADIEPIFDFSETEHTEWVPPPPTYKVVATKNPKSEVPEEWQPILHKILQWLVTLDVTKRPRDRKKLANACSKMCYYNHEAVAPATVFRTLVSKGYISVAGKKINFLKKGEKSVQRMNIGLHNQIEYNSDAEAAEDRCIQWILDPDNTPRNPEALLNTIKQLVTIKKQIPAAQVVQWLVDQESIVVLQDEKAKEFIEYRI